MSTLKQIFELGEFHNRTTTKERIEDIKVWLQQKQQNMTKAEAYNRDHLNGKNEMLVELLEDLQKSE